MTFHAADLSAMHEDLATCHALLRAIRVSIDFDGATNQQRIERVRSLLAKACKHGTRSELWQRPEDRILGRTRWECDTCGQITDALDGASAAGGCEPTSDSAPGFEQQTAGYQDSPAQVASGPALSADEPQGETARAVPRIAPGRGINGHQGEQPVSVTEPQSVPTRSADAADSARPNAPLTQGAASALSDDELYELIDNPKRRNP